MQRIGKWVCLVALLLAAPACNRTVLNVESTFDLAPQERREFVIDPAGREQTIKVHVDPTGGAVNVFVFLAKDKADVEKAIDTRKDTAKILKQELKIENKSVTLEVPIPANHEAIVWVYGTSKAAKVKVKLTN